MIPRVYDIKHGIFATLMAWRELKGIKKTQEELCRLLRHRAVIEFDRIAAREMGINGTMAETVKCV